MIRFVIEIEGYDALFLAMARAFEDYAKAMGTGAKVRTELITERREIQ